MMQVDEILEYLSTIPGGFRSPDDCPSEDDEKFYPPFVKKGVLTVNDEESYHKITQIFCNVPGCELYFDSVFSYQSHYHVRHRYICCECKKSLPTQHLLDLHISELHDSYFAILATRKPMYACFIEECPEKNCTAEERKDHCIRVHKFPKNFRFDNPTVMSRKAPRSANVTDEPMETEKVRLPKKSKHFSFGHGISKTFDRKSYAKALSKTEVSYKNTLEDVNMVNDLLNSLPNES